MSDVSVYAVWIVWLGETPYVFKTKEQAQAFANLNPKITDPIYYVPG